MQSRTDIINFLIRKHQYQSYLEIGLGNGKNFHEIDVPWKVGVDPNSMACASERYLVLPRKSDRFLSNNKARFDIVFVDGDHSYETALYDIQEALKVVSVGGRIIVHDCLPNRVEETERTDGFGYYGGVWRAFLQIRPWWYSYVINTDCGVGVICPDERPSMSMEMIPDNPTFDEYIENRDKWMNIVGEVE